MKSLSIKLRLSLLISLLTLAIILVVSVMAYVEVQESLLRNIDEILRAMGEGIVATLDEHEDPNVREAEFRAIVGGGDAKRITWCRIWADGSEQDLFACDLSEYVDQALLMKPPQAKRPDVRASAFFNIVGNIQVNENYRYRVLWMRRVQGRDVVNVLVGRSSHYVYHELTEFYQLLLVAGAGLTLLAFLMTPIFISFGLWPLAQLGEQLQTITSKNLRQERITSPIVLELQPFIAALDDMLVRLDEAMRQQEQFIADAAHELRTPVAVVKSTLQTIRLKPRSKTEYEQGIDESLHDLARLERLVEQLLSLARLEGTNKSLTTKVCLNVLLDDSIRTFDTKAGRQGGQVVLAESPAIWVRGDEGQLRQLFDNLLDNALRYGPTGGTVCVRIEDESDHSVAVSVHDEGGHLPPEVLAHLFERFYRVDLSRAQASGGSGLGLAIVREIAERHGGTVDITSDPRTGTQATVHLPKLQTLIRVAAF